MIGHKSYAGHIIHVREWATTFEVLNNFSNLIMHGKTNHSCEREMSNPIE